ncbi:helix-turn-helix transcriptional regulator [Amycolatopsis rhabdoformis]|uniref:Helix-turn-helix transcriptional regulator n=1 Tax=Amycolatopsis rhabdoformis TaxID=1448059 RepID=A0ABZ1IJT9_9PSEU|nr:helix-turn-helix transcriptional regulator [Amycolatopsis rhabdoformis]WSE34696.1 helix-turn-helix transcriptional regulator [Amycolatopsis rhabdoformis]
MPESRHESTSPEQNHVLGHDERTPAHVHPRGHLVYPATGVLSLVTIQGSWIAPSNRSVWIPAGFEHQHRAHGSTDMRIVFMDAELAALLPAHPAVLAVTPLAREGVLALTDTDRRPPEVLARLRRVVIDELVAAPEQPLHLPEPADDRLRAVARLAEQDLSSSATLAELGHQVGASERTLSRLFHAETGMSFPRWRTQLRVHRALLLLADGVSVLDTAVACGWANPSAFIAGFSALVGQTPGRYQRSLRDGRP